MSSPPRPSYSFEFKIGLVKRFLEGEAVVALTEEAKLSSPQLLQAWVRSYRRHGEEALRPKLKGRRPKPAEAAEESELEKLRREVEYLRAENAYLGKLAALMDQKRRTR
jgi:transposase